MYTNVSIPLNGKNLTLETGKLAKQAGGSVLLKWGNLVLMANATQAKDAPEGIDFFPLTVEYREKFYATGKIPGGFFKREARPSEKEILTSRLTDRPLRPLFPQNYKNEVQVFVTLLSGDKDNPAEANAITVASAALLISDIPFTEPVAGVRVTRIDGSWKLYSSTEEQKKSDINLILGGTKDAVTMIEGSAFEVSEKEMIEAIKFGHQEIKRLCLFQLDLQKKVNPIKTASPEVPDNSELETKIRSMCFDNLVKANSTKGKHNRQESLEKVRNEVIENLKTELEDSENSEQIEKILNTTEKILENLEVEIVRNQIFKEGIRVDGRKLNEVRNIDIEVGLLPSVHGSSAFTRGETQSLGVVTLGTGNDAQTIDYVEGSENSSFYLHYNFPPYSVGEVRRYTGPGRREIGHGKLAENALRPLIPSQEDFPYVIRVVSEILESNGSSSMATICSGSLAMMDAGIPISSAVAGIAMGLIKQDNDFAILSDIAGLEDHFGDMDFKVAGTEKGITAFQLDLKIDGISYEVMEKALYQAKEGRIHILKLMNTALSESRSQLSKNAPRITTLTIEKERIGELIGPGGKNIRAISETSGADININDDGIVSVVATNGDSAKIAIDMIEGQFAEAEVNKIYNGVIKKLTDFGAFIEILPGKQGLCHISKVASRRVTDINEVLKIGDNVKVKVLAIDRQGRINLSIKDAEY